MKDNGRRFTREELEQLSIAEQNFITTIQSKYKRTTTYKQDAMIADIFDAATGGHIARNFSCGLCSYNMYYEIGRKYFADKEYYKQVDKELEPTKEIEAENNEATNKEQDEKKNRRSTSRAKGGKEKAREEK